MEVTTGPFGGDEPAAAEACEMIRHVGARRTDCFSEVARAL